MTADAWPRIVVVSRRALIVAGLAVLACPAWLWITQGEAG